MTGPLAQQLPATSLCTRAPHQVRRCCQCIVSRTFMLDQRKSQKFLPSVPSLVYAALRSLHVLYVACSAPCLWDVVCLPYRRVTDAVLRYYVIERAHGSNGTWDACR